MDNMDRKQFVDDIIGREPGAWKQLTEEFGPLIYSVLAKSGVSPDEIDDVFQETWVAIDRSIVSIKDPHRLAGWIYGVARRVALMDHRKKTRDPLRLGETLEDIYQGAGDSPDSEIGRLMLRAKLMDLLSQLEPRCRQILTALFLAESPLTYQEITEEFEIPTGSIGATRERCLKKLKEKWIVSFAPQIETADQDDITSNESNESNEPHESH